VLVLLEFQSVDDSNVTVKLEHPDGSEMWALERVTKGQYGFSTPVEGDYKICFLPSDTSNPGALDTHKVRWGWNVKRGSGEGEAVIRTNLHYAPPPPT
jgi:hypothetical protein